MHRAPSIGKKCAFALLSICAFFGAVEATLRLVGFTFRTDQPSIWYQGSPAEVMLVQTGPGVWEPISDVGPFNADGLIGPMVPIERRPGSLRIAALGDSCTHWGDPNYVTVAERLLEKRLRQPVEAINAGVSRYSTEQGLWRLREKVLKYRPDVVTIYFGWNDHWTTDSRTDALAMAEKLPPLAKLLAPLQGSRIVQGAVYVADGAHELLLRRHQSTTSTVHRVPPPQYCENLRRMVELIRAIGAVPILVTAPTSAVGDVYAWDYMGLVNGFSNLPYQTHMDLHDAYVEWTRRTAKELNVPLVDARERLRGVAGLHMDDCIHLTQQGHERIGELVADEIARAASDRRQSTARRD
jgi:lysophospholipase L1-like esterase